MANQFYNSDTGVNWANVGDAALGAGISAATTGGIGLISSVGGSLLKGLSSSYFNKKSEKRAYQRMLRQMEAEYQYAQRYAENSPSWTVKGLRDAGINPILPFVNGVPSSPSVGSHSQNATSTDVSSDIRYDPLLFKQIQLLDSQIEGQKIKNLNDSMNRGLTGKYGAYSRMLSEVGVPHTTPSHRPSDFSSVLSGIRSFLDSFPQSKKTPNIDDSSSYSDTPPEMSKWQQHVITDGFDSRLWSRSRHKWDGKNLYERRQPWKSVFWR